MRGARWNGVWVAATLAAITLLGGCVELTGQRITLCHDEASDRLLLLIAYDGIHESPSGHGARGREQIPKFARQGDVMLLDWWGHIERARIKHLVEAPETPPALQRLATALLEVRSLRIGHYRDPEGRIGAAQLLVVDGARLLVRRVNDAINEVLLAKDREGKPRGLFRKMPRTLARLREGARKGRQWVELDGHALTAFFPVDPFEWARARAAILGELFKKYEEIARRHRRDEGDVLPGFLVQTLAAGAVSESGGAVTFRVGREDRPSTFRFLLRDRYNGDLEATVTSTVPDGLDEGLATWLLEGRESALPEPLRKLGACLPPEDRVRAVLHVAQGSDPEDRRQAARTWLSAFAARWNRERGDPEAPGGGAPLDRWNVWYRKMLAWPLPE